MDLAPYKEKMLEMSKRHAKEMAQEMVVELIFPALKQAAQESAMPWDDMAMAALEEPLKKAALDLIGKL